MNELNERLERMIAIAMTAFPDSWPDADKRELAMRQLGMIVEDEA